MGLGLGTQVSRIPSIRDLLEVSPAQLAQTVSTKGYPATERRAEAAHHDHAHHDEDAAQLRRNFLIALVLTLPVFIAEMGGHLVPVFHHWLHATIGTTLGEVRATRAQFTDSVIEKDPGAFPLTKRHRPPSRGKVPTQPKGVPAALASAVTGVVKQFRSVRSEAVEVPEERVAAMAAKWWRLSHLDSAVVTSADGAGASMYVRDPKKFRAYLRRSARLHQRLIRQWSGLSSSYRTAMPEFTSPEAWRETFANNGAGDDA